MKKRTILVLVICVVMALGFAFSGCANDVDTESGKTEATKEATDTTKTTEENTTEENTTDQTSTVDAWLQPFVETVNVTGIVGYDVDSGIKEGTTPETNTIVTMCKDLLNIDIEILWSVSSDQFKEKQSLAYASGDIPDLLFLESGDFYDFLNNGSLMDITDAWDTYASDDLVDIMESVSGDPLGSCSKDGKLYAVPAVLNTAESTAVLYYRADWLEALNMSVPTTAEEMMDMFVAFAKNDPDGNGEDDTIGLIAYGGNVLGTTMGLQGFYQTFGAYPTRWIFDGDGTVVNGTTSDTTKVALDAIADCYARGGMPTDFATYDGDQANQKVISGKVGALFGSYWIPAGAMHQTLNEDPNCEWACMQLVNSTNADAGDALSIISENPIYFYNSVYANSNPDAAEALVKIISLEMAASSHSSYDKTVFNGLEQNSNGFALFYTPVYIYYPTPWVKYQTNIREAITSGDTSMLGTQTQIDWYNYSVDWLENDGAEYGPISWGMWFSRVTDQGGMGLILKDVVGTDEYINDVFYGQATETEINVSSTLSDMTTTFFIDHIMGNKTDADWESFVNDWFELGGQDWTTEVNDAYDAIH